MRIKLAILENDQSYLQRIVAAFNAKYSDKLELYSFTDQDIALKTVESARIDVLIASDTFTIDTNTLPAKCGFSYFVDSADISTIKGQRAICKFQKAELIYKQIVSLYSENAGNISGIKLDDETSKIALFCSPSGGVGNSSMAASCAIHFAERGKKTLYLNLEKYGSADCFFKAEGQFNMSDVIFSLKNKKSNLSLKLESCVKQDLKGVYFYSQSEIALDMLEINGEEISRLITELKITGEYDYIIIDTDFSLDKDCLSLLKMAHFIIWIGDGSEISNAKIQRTYSALSVLEQSEDVSLLNRTHLIYNKFSNKTSRTVGEIGLNNIGGAPRYERATSDQVIAQLSTLPVFDQFI